MANQIRSTTADIEGLAAALKELGIITNRTKDEGGIFEKQQRKLKKQFKNNPYVKAAKSAKQYFKAFKQIGEYTRTARSVGEEKLEQMEEEMTGLTKLTATMLFHTGVAKMMNKIGGNTNRVFKKILINVLSLVVIFAMVAFAIGIVVLAFQGADSPLLDFTDGLWGIDEAAQGIVMAFTGEGEGGLLGAINVVVAALATAGIAFMLFGGPVALLAGSVVLLFGVYQLMMKEFNDSTAAFGAVTTLVLVLAAAFLYWKFAAIAAKTVSIGAINATIGVLLIGVALIIGGLTMLYLFATGKVSGWLGWALAAIGAFLVGVGVAIIIGFTWPIVAVVALIALVVAVVYRNWDDISAFFKSVPGAIIAGVSFLIEAFKAGIGVFVTVVATGCAIAIGVITYPILFVKNLVIKLWTDFKAAKKKGWRGILRWLLGIPQTIKSVAISTAKSVFNAIAGIYNAFARTVSFEIPGWVPIIGGNEWNMPQIPKLAKGGIVNKPTLAMIGEAGPEAVVPLSGNNARNAANQMGLGKGVTININVGGVTDRTDKRALAREIGDALRDEMFRSGRSMGTRRGAV